MSNNCRVARSSSCALSTPGRPATGSRCTRAPSTSPAPTTDSGPGSARTLKSSASLERPARASEGAQRGRRRVLQDRHPAPAGALRFPNLHGDADQRCPWTCMLRLPDRLSRPGCRAAWRADGPAVVFIPAPRPVHLNCTRARFHRGNGYWLSAAAKISVTAPTVSPGPMPERRIGPMTGESWPEDRRTAAAERAPGPVPEVHQMRARMTASAGRTAGRRPRPGLTSACGPSVRAGPCSPKRPARHRSARGGPGKDRGGCPGSRRPRYPRRASPVADQGAKPAIYPSRFPRHAPLGAARHRPRRADDQPAAAPSASTRAAPDADPRQEPARHENRKRGPARQDGEPQGHHDDAPGSTRIST
jgi:hypothetical protein